MAELKVKVEFTSAVVRPGHTLVVACPQDLTAQQHDGIHRDLEHRLPGVDVVVLGGVSQMLVYEPAAQDAQE